MANDIDLKLGLDTKGFGNGIKDADRAAEKLRKNLGDVGKGAGAALGTAFAGAGKSLNNLVSSVFSLKGALVAAVGAFSVTEIVSAAIEADAAIAGVANSLRLAGDLSKDSLDDVQTFAGALQDTTGIGDDTTLSMIALAQSFGLTREEAKKTVRVAADLSAATGKDLSASVEALSASFNGNIGKLGKLNPALKGLSGEALAAGQALDVLGNQFAGSASAKLDTFAGALGSAKTRFGDVIEEIGRVVTQSPAMVAVLKTADSVFKNLAESIANNRSGLQLFIRESLKGLVQGTATAVKSIKVLSKAFGGVTASDFGEVFRSIGTAIAFATDEILLLARGFTELKLLLKDPLAVFQADSLTQLKLARPQLAGLVRDIETLEKLREQNRAGVAGSTRPPVADDNSLEGSLDKLLIALDTLPTELKTSLSGPQGAGPDMAARTTEKAGKKDPYNWTVSAFQQTVPLPEGFQRTGANDSGDPSGAVDRANRDAANNAGIRNESLLIPIIDGAMVEYTRRFSEAGKGIAAGFAQNVLGGADGAKKFIGAAAGAVVDVFAPGFGQIAGPLIEGLTAGPEAVKAQVNAFADALPVLIDGLIDAIPVLIETLADRAPAIITKLVDSAPKIAVAIAKALSNPQLYVQVGAALGQAALEGLQYQSAKFGEALSVGIPAFQEGVTNAGKSFAEYFKTQLPESVKEGLAAIADPLEKAFTAPIDALKKGLDVYLDFPQKLANKLNSLLEGLNPFGGGGGGGGFLGTGLFAATGGIIRGSGNRDSVPATLAPGELVIDRTTGPRLNRFMDEYVAGQSNSSGTDPMVAAMLAKVIDLLQRPMEVSTSIEIDKRELANVTLQLNRTNQRLA